MGLPWVNRVITAAIGIIVIAGGAGVDVASAGYPDRNIRLIISFEPGGITDLVGRALAQHMNPHLNGKIYVENVTGAAGAIGFRAGAKAAPDGYTLTLVVSSIAVGPHVVKDYPTFGMFDFIATAAQNPMLVLVRSESQFKSASDLIGFAKANPGKLSACHAGVGSLSHLSIAAFANAAGARINFVPYKGSGPCLTAILGGHVDLGPAGVVEAFSLLEGKKVVPLAVLGTKRSATLPGVPTARELGYDATIYQWAALAAPRGTPEDIKRLLGDVMRKATEEEGFKQFLERVGMEPIFLRDAAASGWVKDQNDYFNGVVRSVGLSPK